MAVELRKRRRLRHRDYCTRGANHIWHVDCYEKLKAYGITINYVEMDFRERLFGWKHIE